MYRKVKIHFHQFCIVGGSWRVSSYSRWRNWGSSGGGSSQMFLWKSQAQDMGQLKFTMHWLPSAMKQNMHKCNEAKHTQVQ